MDKVKELFYLIKYVKNSNMEITTTTVHELKWDFPSANEFNATITNGKITELYFRDVGDLTTKELCSINEKYLRNIHKALHELLHYLDKTRNVGNGNYAIDMYNKLLNAENDGQMDCELEADYLEEEEENTRERILFIKH